MECHQQSAQEGHPLRLRVFVAGRNRLELISTKALSKAFIVSNLKFYLRESVIWHKLRTAGGRTGTFKILFLHSYCQPNFSPITIDMISDILIGLGNRVQVNSGTLNWKRWIRTGLDGFVCGSKLQTANSHRLRPENHWAWA